jgi:hypothetical protein
MTQASNANTARTTVGVTSRGPAPISSAVFSVPEFCKEHRISRALFYILLNNGTGPRLMRVRGRTLVTADAAAEWRRRMEELRVRRPHASRAPYRFPKTTKPAGGGLGAIQ